MTPKLQDRLDGSKPPFDGACIHNTDTLNLTQLRSLLSTTIGMLSSSNSEIYSFHDWHEHDGFIVDSKIESWDTLTAAIETDRTLFDSRDDDFDVRIAFYPRALDWLLRYNIDQDEESDYKTATCDFDLSVANENQIPGVVDELLGRFPVMLAKCESIPWFNSNYGG